MLGFKLQTMGVTRCLACCACCLAGLQKCNEDLLLNLQKCNEDLLLLIND